MRYRPLLLAAVSIGLLAAPLAHAQLAINVPVPAPETMAPGTGMAGQPDTMGTLPAMGSSPGGAAGTPDPSTVVVYSDGIRQRVKTYADASTVRAFEPDQGLLSLQDGMVVRFPDNFAFVDTPQPGQPVTIYYFQDRDGNAVLSAIDLGGQGGDSGGG
jgi:hypothetical protein